MDSEYLVRARLGMTGDIGGRPPGLGLRSFSGSPSKTSYLLDGLPTSGANKRPRPVDADAVTLDNYHVSKRYLTEMMASSLNLLKVGDSKDDGTDGPPMSELLSSSLPSEGGSLMEQRFMGSLPRYSSAALSAGGDDMMSNQGDSAMSDDNGDTDDDSSPGSWRRNNMLMQEAQFKSPEAAYGPDGTRRRPNGGGIAASNLATSSLASPVPPAVTGPGAWGIPAHTSTHPYAIPSRHHALQQKEGDSRLPPSPSDPAQSANLRRAALLRSLQMRGQAPSTAHSPTQVPSGLGQSVSSGFKLGPSALAMGNPPEFRLNRGVESGAREGVVEGKPGWVPAPGGGQSVLSPVPEMDPQEGAMMDETGGQEGLQDGKRETEKETRDMSSEATFQSNAGRNEDLKGGWRQQTTRVKGWGESTVKKDLNAGWEQDEKRAISDFRPAGSQWNSQTVRKWGGAENGIAAQKPGWSPQGGTGSARGLADGFGTTPRPAKGLWGTAPKSPPLSGIVNQQKSPQWKAGASNLMDGKEDPLSPGEPMSPGWGPTDTEDFPPLTSGGKQWQGSAQQGERKVVWKPRLKANSLELTSSPDYGSFTDRGSCMQVARSRSASVPSSSGLHSSDRRPQADSSLSKLGTSAVAGTPTFGGREKVSEEAPSGPESQAATAMEDDAQDRDEHDKASPRSIFAPPTFIPPLIDQPSSAGRTRKSATMQTIQQPGGSFASTPRPGFYQSASPEFRGVQQGARQSPLQGSPSPPQGSLTAAFNRSFSWTGATTPPPERGLPTVSRGFGTGVTLSFSTPQREQSANASVPATPGAPLFHRRRPSIVIQNSAKDDPPPQDSENMEGT
ncbi:hypothetical protein KFL_002060140 [Klebsormidium nitens]|uniref:Uncharacterized protein n=1 Tax=Klebsormidium nitens TaxID=105231 RepID=A0A1Y1I2U6_KLENI|nr:hypothetical protein KFL_002060140 [Klebsormidium nitens]|eukprot:GAQ84793.1 hypothetical protein KFL_002060140 [Klebsormidium nitens]